MVTLNIENLCKEARLFSAEESRHLEPTLFGVTDGKAVGTYLEHKFRAYLKSSGYQFLNGNSASGIDFPDLNIDMKVTSIKQPQSSCPFKSARQKVYGLGYSLIVFAYDKVDDSKNQSARLRIQDAIFVDSAKTGDFQVTKGLRDILDNKGNSDDLKAFLIEKNLPIDEIGLESLSTEIMSKRPQQGYLAISNALQWRLQYARVIEVAGIIDGIQLIHKEG